MITIQQMLNSVNKDPGWMDILTEQERILRPETLTCSDALKMGIALVDIAKKPMAVSIELNGAIVFSHHMDGTTCFHDWFIAQKSNVVRATGVSSMRAFLNYVYNGMYRDAQWTAADANYVLCGGSIPLILENGERIGMITASGGTHEEDHQWAAEAFASCMGITIPSILV